jgi:hypothetical protein
VRVDARALGLQAGKAPEARPSAVTGVPRAEGWSLARLPAAPAALRWVAGCVLALAWAMLVVVKSREVRAACAAAGAKARPLLPIPTLFRALASSAAVTAGLALQIDRPTPTWGSVLVALGALLAAHGYPEASPPPRGPGRWLPVSPAEAFAPTPRSAGAWLDAGTRRGALVFAGLVALVVGGGVALAVHGKVDRGVVVALDAAALFPLFLTGRTAELPPDPALAPRALLHETARRAEALLGPSVLKIVPRIRIPKGGADPDDLRVSLAPLHPLAGLRGVVLGATFGRGAFGWVALPEILVRVATGSPAERALYSVARRARTMEGARPDERVLSFVPRLPTARVTAALAAAVVARVTAPPGARGLERPAPRALSAA